MGAWLASAGSLSTGLCARGTGDWGGWFQVEARYWVVRLHVPPASCVGCVAGPP